MRSGKTSRLYKAKPGVACDGFHPKVPLEVTEETTVPGEGGTQWQMAATSLHDDVLFDS